MAAWLLVAFLARAGLGLWLAGEHPDQFLGGDGREYLEAARNLVAGKGYAFNSPRLWDWAAYDPSLSESDRLAPKPETFRPPLYPLLLAPAVALWGDSLVPVAVLNALLAVVAGWFLYDLARRALSVTVGEWGLRVFALYPMGVALDARVAAEPLFEAALCACVWALWRARESSRCSWASLAGLALGLATLTRSNAVFLWPLVVGWLAVFVRGRRILPVWFVVWFVVTVLPWGVRNRLVTGEWIFLSASGGYNFWLGNNEVALRMFTARTSAEYDAWGRKLLGEMVPARVRELGTDEVAVAQRFWYSQAWGFIREHPVQWVWLLGAKAVEFWRPYVRPGFFPMWQVWLSWLTTLPLLVLGAAGLWLAVRHHPAWGWLILAVVVAGMAGLVLSHVHARLRVPFVDLFFTVCAAHAVVSYWQRRRGAS